MAQIEREAELVAGRYRVLRELARGGVGVVYEAVDESTGRRVALKRLERSGDRRLALLFESEYDTLARLKHPGIVEVFDYGIDKRGPYFTMELLDGQDLSELEPIPYRQACSYLRDVASSLALLHTRRRLHRDLSPRNVRVTSDGRCRLLDFGTMANFGVSPMIVGTPPMVPPEALGGRALDHRSDLYSLGALAYRVLSARYAYRARQLEDLPLLWRTPPTRLREVAPDVPPELEDLVMSMLSLDPTYRPNTTYEVIDRLTAIGALPPDADLDSTAEGYLVGSRLIGRSRQLSTIQRRIAGAQREHGSTLVIEGNPGVGKSRLLDEATLQAQLAGALTVRVDARAHPGQYGVANALVQAILEAAPHDARDIAEPYLSSLQQVFEAFEQDGRTRGSHERPADPSATTTRSQLHHTVLNWLFDLAEDRTLVLLVDDLPRVDEGSAALLNSLSHSLPAHRILLIAARRLIDKRVAPAGVDAIVARSRRLRLHRLKREDTAAVIQSLFGAVPNLEQLADWIHDVTTGSPMQIMELARHLVRENAVRFVDGMWVLPPNVPHDRLQHNLAATLSARLAALPGPERALAEALSVRRGIISLPLCTRLADDKDTRNLFRHLDELVAKGVLISGANGYHFGQDVLRQVLLRQLPAKRAKRLHLRLGEALLQYESGHPEDLIEAGFNLILGGAEMRGADLVAWAATKLPHRGVTTTQALPALEAALEVYEKWGRSPNDCLRLRAVLAGAMDKRATARYGETTLKALCAYAGGAHADELAKWLGGRAGYWAGFTVTQLGHWVTPKPQRGPRPRSALIAFYRVAFGVLGVRTSLLDVAGTDRLARMAQSLATAGPINAVVADVFRAQVLAMQGDIDAALRCGRELLERLDTMPAWARYPNRAVKSGVLATLYIGIGMLEAHYCLRSESALAVITALTSLAQQAHLEEPVIAGGESGVVSELELRMAAQQLRLALHLARGERGQAEARTEPRHGGVVPTGMHRQFEVWRNALDCDMSMRTQDVAGLRRCVETFTHYVVEHVELVSWLEIARAHLALCLGKPQEALLGYSKWIEVLQPGRALCWDTLCFGYAEALLACGEAERARTWLAALLEQPVVASARRTSAWVPLEALLALAEAECGRLGPAEQRVSALAREIEGSDHPLAFGFVHEVGARIAHKRRDDATSETRLNEMKRWYEATHNEALLMRGQRVADSLTEVRPSSVPTAAVGDDRNMVTRVTSRRD
ncbi:MAG: protein kinase [Polyangiales bacterium]